MGKDESRGRIRHGRRLQRFSRLFSKAGLSGLSSQVYILVFLGFLFSLGRNISFSYLAMFLAGKTQSGGLAFDPSLVGLMLTIGGLTSIFALPAAGHLCDRFGRKRIMLFSLVPQVALTVGFAYARAYAEFLLLFTALSIVMALYQPAHSAMIADLVEPEKREHAYGLDYMIGNVGFMVGLPIGGLIASTSGFSVLYFYCAVLVGAAAAGVSLLIRESKPEQGRNAPSYDVASVFRDKVFMLFCLMMSLTNFLYVQFYSLLSVYTEHLGFEPYVFGTLSAIAGAMVVTLQIPIRLGTVRIGPAKAFIIAQTFFAAGFTCFMVASNFIEFLAAIAVLTLGEIIFYPAASAFAANLAPGDMRGRYIAVMGLFSGIGGSTASITVFSIYGMLVNKNVVWGIWGAFGFAVLPGYFLLSKVTKNHKN
ncbi:MAG: MFS transporter [Candidatus Bathyarchaeia archaeon]